MLHYIRIVWELTRTRIALLRAAPERGEITTTVIVIAVLAIAAITLLAFIVAKLTRKVNSINLGLGG
ncbi:hypothetical protein [Amycolatopsis sp. CA-230715]|uniref:hypothetical protein n=1 Tax=Amycolatopsis sp. CA-230715 TaxID=2745196 RepID=UPI001C01986A|nr:hypothetical protein [Amycolatopsis sp. CA-230715]QWF81013.1 hypothetical protein HUW46_04438 [Amycolatopsis sp. CA-230715]